MRLTEWELKKISELVHERLTFNTRNDQILLYKVLLKKIKKSTSKIKS
jgi:hypothetical protein